MSKVSVVSAAHRAVPIQSSSVTIDQLLFFECIYLRRLVPEFIKSALKARPLRMDRRHLDQQLSRLQYMNIQDRPLKTKKCDSHGWLVRGCWSLCIHVRKEHSHAVGERCLYPVTEHSEPKARINLAMPKTEAWIRRFLSSSDSHTSLFAATSPHRHVEKS